MPFVLLENVQGTCPTTECLAAPESVLLCSVLRASRNTWSNRNGVELLAHSILYSAQQLGRNFFSNFSGHWSKCPLKCYYPEEKLDCLAPKIKFMCPARSVYSAVSAQNKHTSTKHVHKLHEKEVLSKLKSKNWKIHQTHLLHCRVEKAASNKLKERSM